MEYSFKLFRKIQGVLTDTPLSVSEIRAKLNLNRKTKDTMLEQTLIYMESNNRILYGKDKNKEPTFYAKI